MHRSTPLVLAAMALLTVSPRALATFPGENGLIVYQAQTDAGTQLFTMQPDGSGIQQITHVDLRTDADHPGAAWPDWSPDGRTIVFNENDCQMTLVNPDGNDLREVPAESGVCENDPSFTPDGGSLVYDRYDPVAGTEGIWVTDIDGTERHHITDACIVDPNVSPDGTRLSCKGPGDNPGQLTVVAMDGTGAMTITAPSGERFHDDWAPDGSAIVFTYEFRAGSAGFTNVATIAPDGTDLRYLTDLEAGVAANWTSYSPDGRSIVFREYRSVGGRDEFAVFIMAADGSDVRQITEWSDSFAPQALDWGSQPTYPELDCGATPAPSPSCTPLPSTARVMGFSSFVGQPRR